jgi:hypothetical protein
MYSQQSATRGLGTAPQHRLNHPVPARHAV